MVDSKEIMQEVVSDIMTDMFFLFPDINDEGDEVTEKENGDGAVHVGIHYHTDKFLHIAIDEMMLREMTANFLGLSPDEITQENIESMAKEAANILGGNYLVRIDPDSNQQLSIPDVIEQKTPEKYDWNIGFVSEDSVINLYLCDK